MTDSRQHMPSNFVQQAQADFDSAHRKSNFRQMLAALTHQSNQLLPYDQVLRLLPVSGQHYVGMRQVPIDAIVGSVGRFQDFDRAFLPRGKATRGRWESIDRAHLMDIDLPAIEVYKLGEVYFVKDGNHRVSVARERGQAFIDAVVIEINTPIPITPDTDLLDLIGQREKIRFFKKTRIKELRPDSNVELSIPEMYSKLLEHIQTHGWFLGEERHACVSFEEATTSWYDNIYLPMINIIRGQQILNGFPDRTEADLYLWIMEHRWFLMKDQNSDISLEDAARDFFNTFAENPVKRFIHRISQILFLSKRKKD
ncbi:DUF4032 domain-containing protein [Leptolinea tardivitalis]|nr:DUF4032 domain-containing protein [Leptolinea tardivitalis]GAP20644.1 transcriptional regulator [Leptolinea tardivitalis]